MIEFRQPLFLLLLLLLPLLVPVARRSLADLARPQVWLATGLRALGLALVVIALAGPSVPGPGRRVAAVFVVDHSGSVPGESREAATAKIGALLETMEDGDRAAVIGFGEEARILQPLQERPRMEGASSMEEDGAPGTDIAGALDFAAALLPMDAERRIVLFSDGNATRGDANAAAARLAALGVRVDVMPLAVSTAPEVALRAARLPARLQEKEPFSITANITSNIATPAVLRLMQNDYVVGRRELELEPGEREIVFDGLQTDAGFATFELEIQPVADTRVENNRVVAGAGVNGAPRILVLDGNEESARPFADAMQRAGFDVEIRGTTGAPATLQELQGWDLLILSDYSALNLDAAQMELYRDWVETFGGAMLMAGGENAFGVGGYLRTPIEEMLPVRMEHDDRQELPTVALLVVLDRSGSMGAQVQGQTKMALANQGAVLAMNVLKDRDYFGMFAVDTVVHRTVPLSRISGRAAIEQRILSVVAGGGGIYIYTSLVEASRALREVNAKIKHIILFSDAADAEEKFAGEMRDGTQTGGNSLDLAASMAAGGITTSVVALGFERDRDYAFLRLLAERGGGRFYLTNNALNLPQIFTTETMKIAQSSLVEEPFQAKPSDRSPMTQGIDWSGAPLLLGYNMTKPKPTAKVALTTEFGDPLLATWRYGLGQAGAFTSDIKSRWASEWLVWPGYSQLWSQVLRALVRRDDLTDFRITTFENDDALRLTMDVTRPDGAFWDGLKPTVVALGPDGKSEETRATQTAPGRYEALLADSKTPGITMISISDPDGMERPQLVAHTRNYPTEFLPLATNREALAAIASAGNGSLEPETAGYFAERNAASRTRLDLSRWCLIAALLLFPIDIAVRRLTWPKQKARSGIKS